MKAEEISNSQIFANELYFSSDMGLMANECERFGMTWGCREDCPVFMKGKCEQQKENEKYFNTELTTKE